MSSGQMNSTQPLIAPKSFPEYGVEEFHAHVTGMYELRKRSAPVRPTNNKSSVAGISLTQAKSGRWSLRHVKSGRNFKYVTKEEIQVLSAGPSGLTQNELWQMFQGAEWIIANDRMHAERIFAEQNKIPF